MAPGMAAEWQWPEQAPDSLRPYGFVGRPGDRCWPLLELGVTDHAADGGYHIDGVLASVDFRVHWRTSARLHRLHAELHDPVKKGLGQRAYQELFGQSPFAGKWGSIATTTARLDAWCHALAFAVGCGAVPAPLLAGVLDFLNAPKVNDQLDESAWKLGATPSSPVGSERSTASASDSSLASLPQEQFIFLVRHAESRWNAAQGGAKLVAMYKEQDHGVSLRGREQAEQLRHEILRAAGPGGGDSWTSRFWNAGAIVTSPLTRAIQTSIIALRDVLATGTGELVVMKAARERRGLGGADTVGAASGDAIRDRVRAELDLLYPGQENWEEALSPAASHCASPSGCEARRLRRTKTSEQRLLKRRSLLEAFDYITLDVSDVREKWWDSAVEAPADFRGRVEQLMLQLRSCGEENVIVVGHSLLFRGIFQAFAGAPAPAAAGAEAQPGGTAEPEGLRSKLCREKIPNCGVIGLRVDWSGGDGPMICEVVPMFGTQVPGTCGEQTESGVGDRGRWVHGLMSSLKRRG